MLKEKGHWAVYMMKLSGNHFDPLNQIFIDLFLDYNYDAQISHPRSHVRVPFCDSLNIVEFVESLGVKDVYSPFVLVGHEQPPWTMVPE